MPLIVGFASFLLGSLSFAYIVTRLRAHSDIRDLGSRNAGALNVGRELGASWGVLVLLLDAAKGAAAVAVATALTGESTPPLFAAALGVVVGHNWPVFLSFRGGKGVAPVFGISLAVLPILTLVTVALATLTFAVTRNAVGAITLGILALNALTIATGQAAAQTTLCLLLSVIVVGTHLFSVRSRLWVAYRARRWLDFFLME